MAPALFYELWGLAITGFHLFWHLSISVHQQNCSLILQCKLLAKIGDASANTCYHKLSKLPEQQIVQYSFSKNNNNAMNSTSAARLKKQIPLSVSGEREKQK